MLDVIVAGAGPNGLYLAAQLAMAGLSVRCVDPRSDAPWVPHYGLWQPDAQSVGLAGGLLRATWQQPQVILTEAERHALPHAYVLLNNAAVQAQWIADLQSAGAGALVADAIAHVEHCPDGSLRVHLASGADPLHARMLIDATGWPSALGTSAPGRPGYQTAWGEVRRWTGDTDALPMVLMDYSHAFESVSELPSFLYCLPWGDRVLVEETVLVRRPAVGLDALRTRLHRRLNDSAMWGSRPWPEADVLEAERCHFAMGAPLAGTGGPAVAWGAAASMVHPATGYSLGHTLRWARELAQHAPQLAALEPRQAQAALQELTMPANRRQAWVLYVFGMDLLADLNLAQTREFFGLFFRQAPEAALDYLRWAEPQSIRRHMMRMFAGADARWKWRMMRSIASPLGPRVVADMVGRAPF